MEPSHNLSHSVSGMCHPAGYLGPLHRHPKLEERVSLNEDHVIVDKEDWEGARDLIRENNDPCYLGNEWNQCCCNCANHFEDFYDCTTDRDLRREIELKLEQEGKNISLCICSMHKGWICMVTMDGQTRAHSDWPEHAIGCELYKARKKVS